MGLAPLALATLLLASPRARLEVASEVGAYVGSDTPDPPSLGAARSLTLTPSVGAVVDDRTAALEARYAPRFLLRDAGPSSLGVRHAGLLAGTLRQSRSLQWIASERFRYGRNELTWDPGATRPFDSFEAIAPVIPDEIATDSELGFAFQASANVSLNATAGYAAEGGASAASRQLLPFQHGPQLYAGLDQELARNDRLSTELYGSLTDASNGRQNAQLKLSESWRRLLSATTRGRLSAGASAYRRERAPEPTSLGVFPVAAASVEHEVLERTRRVELLAVVSLGPHQSRLTAQLLERAELAASARWILQGGLSLRGRAGAAHELGAGGTRFFLGGLDLAYQIRPEISLAAGTETLWQQVPAQGTAFAFRWLAFTGLRVGARDLL